MGATKTYRLRALRIWDIAVAILAVITTHTIQDGQRYWVCPNSWHLKHRIAFGAWARGALSHTRCRYESGNLGLKSKKHGTLWNKEENDTRIFAGCARVGTSTTIPSQGILQRSYYSRHHWRLEAQQQVLHHSQAASLCLWHGNNRPWPPFYATHMYLCLHGLSGLAVYFKPSNRQR